MSKEVVLFRSKTGYTLQYAEWISKALKCDMIENRRLKVRDLEQYDTIILCGGVYLGTINGFEFVLKNWESLKEKKIYVLAVGLEQVNSERIEQIWNRGLTREQRTVISCHYALGGLNFPKLGFLDKLIMRIFKLMMMTTKAGQKKTNHFTRNLKHPVNYIDKEYIETLINDVQSERDRKIQLTKYSTI